MELTNGVWSDAHFRGILIAKIAQIDRNTAHSRTGYVKCAGCPFTWSSNTQTEMALCTTKAEFPALSEGLRTTISVIGLMEAMMSSQADIKCTVFEDNSGALTIAMMSQSRTHTNKSTPNTGISGRIWNKVKYP